MFKKLNILFELNILIQNPLFADSPTNPDYLTPPGTEERLFSEYGDFVACAYQDAGCYYVGTNVAEHKIFYYQNKIEWPAVFEIIMKNGPRQTEAPEGTRYIF